LFQRLLTDYQTAKSELESGNLPQAAATFRSVASRCPESELELQCEFLAAHAEWTHHPCEASLALLDRWFQKFEKREAKRMSSGSYVENKLFRSWADRVQYIQAHWEREHQSLDAAEQRLRKLLEFQGDKPSLLRCPEGWLELGELLRDDRKQFESANQCFQQALALGEGSASVTNRALWGLVLSFWQQKQIAEANEWLSKLIARELDDTDAIQTQLLRIKIADSLGQKLSAVEVLEPLIPIALTGSPQAAAMYDLAMSLVALGEITQGDAILVRLVHRFPNTPLSLDARIRLARHASDRQQWQQTEIWCSQALQGECTPVLIPHALAMRGQAFAALGQPEKAVADFTLALATPDLNVDLQVALRFHLSEVLYLQEKWKEAEPHLQWLAAHATSQPASNRTSDSWLPTVLLRTAELLALKKEWSQAEKIVLSLRSDFPECNKRSEVDYLYARCMISKADFDAARTVLAMLAKDKEVAPELRARANWMVGETYLMQRNHAEARIAYQRVLDVPQQSYWHAAALLQLGHCNEALSDLTNARAAYERIVNEYSDCPYFAAARERLSKLAHVNMQTADAKNATGPKR
jgi:TolA-binding protein